MRKLGRSRSENLVSQSQRAPGLVGLLESMRVQMEVLWTLERLLTSLFFDTFFSYLPFCCFVII